MIRAQRIAALRVTRAYRTVSAEAALFLRELLRVIFCFWNAKESEVRSKLDDPDRADSKDEIRRAERDILLAALFSNRWSRGWRRLDAHDSSGPDERTKRCPKDLTFHVTQALTGHGCFRHYLHRMKRAPDAAVCTATTLRTLRTHDI
ncbi:uncharacterized protein LOC126555594 [Aphis gossypii]|uniref:uncharacterized protein LOC126555594 n=1 Tax=Aphis gossypii TaxID=80765 RepID=UPI002159A538|nr:uncharacterized protein LOC126555594 [Aphis gossypii]